MRRNHEQGTARALPEDAQDVRARLKTLAWWLDNAIRLPGGFRIGLDALIGLVPFIGDAAGVLASAYIVQAAGRLGAPPSLLLRMAFNVAVEGIVGMIPFAGDLFDAAWKANQRNVQLLDRYLDQPVPVTRSSRLFVALVAVLLIAFMMSVIALSVLFVRWIWNTIGG